MESLGSTGNGLTQVNTFVTDARFDAGSYEPVSRVHVGDVNGDGRSDLLTCEPRIDAGPGQPWHVRYHNGNGRGQDRLVHFVPGGGQDCRHHVVMILDANGDGVSDLLLGGYDNMCQAAIFTGPTVTYQPTGISTIVGYNGHRTACAGRTDPAGRLRPERDAACFVPTAERRHQLRK